MRLSGRYYSPLRPLYDTLNSLTEALRQLLQHSNPDLPFASATVDALHLYDASLRGENRRNALYLICLNVDNVHHAAWNTCAILSRGVGAVINFSGARGTYSLRETWLYSVIHTTRLTRFVACGVSPEEVAKSVKKWFHTVRYNTTPQPMGTTLTSTEEVMKCNIMVDY
ncbi:unnamed protein product [Dicrocoelium dendriticum]|nr:unnamed protein product [Dicrocoelium dendriticum]